MNDLSSFAQELLEAGFRVWSSAFSRCTFLVFSIDNHMGYCELNPPHTVPGIRFITMHRPCVEYGTGFFIENSPPTIEAAERCAKTFGPSWSCYSKAVKKWTLDQWLKSHWSNGYKEITKEAPQCPNLPSNDSSEILLITS